MSQQDAIATFRRSLVKALRRRSSRASYCDTLRTWSKVWGARRTEPSVGVIQVEVGGRGSIGGRCKRLEEGGESSGATSTAEASLESTNSSSSGTGDKQQSVKVEPLVDDEAHTEQEDVVEGINVQLLERVAVPEEAKVYSPRLVRLEIPRDAKFRLQCLAQLDLRKSVPSFEYQAGPEMEGKYQGDTTRRLVSMAAI